MNFDHMGVTKSPNIEMKVLKREKMYLLRRAQRFGKVRHFRHSSLLVHGFSVVLCTKPFVLQMYCTEVIADH